MNNLHPLDPSLDLCLQDLHKHSGLITAPSHFTQSMLINELAVQSCIHRQKILFVYANKTEDGVTIPNLNKLLPQSVKDLRNPKSLGESELRQLQAIKKNAQLAQKGYTHKLLDRKVKSLNRKISQIEKITKCSFGKSSIRSLVWKLRNEINPLSTDMVHLDINLTSDVFEFAAINEQVNKAAQIYNVGFEKIDQINHISATCLTTKNMHQIFSDLKTFEAELSDIILQLKNKLKANQINLKSQFTKSYDRVRELIFELELLQDEQAPYGASDNTMKKLFGNKSNSETPAEKKEITHLLSDLHLELAEMGINTSQNLSSIDPQDILDQLELKKQELNKSVSKRLRQLNTVNSASADLFKIDQDCKALIDRINKAEIFDFTIEDNGFNIFQKIVFLEKTLKTIQTNIWVIQNQTSFIEWKKWFHQLSTDSKSIIQALFKYPTDHWKVLFQDYYLKSFIDHQNSSFTLESLAKENHWVADQKVIENLSQILAEISALRQLNGFEQLKKSDSGLYNILMRKTKDIPENWLDILTANPSFVSDIFPVLIMDEHHYNKSSDASRMVKVWDKIVLVGFDKFESINLDLVSKNAHNYIFISNEKLPAHTLDRLDTFIGADTFASHTLDIDYTKVNYRLSEYNLHQRLEMTDVLASKILSIKPELSIYKTKNDCFISFLDDETEQYLSNYLNNLVPKRIIINGDKKDSLLDILVDNNTKIHFITQDHLLNPVFLNALKWQYNFMKELSVAGLNHINLSTTQPPLEIKNQLNNAINSIVATESAKIKTETELETV